MFDNLEKNLKIFRLKKKQLENIFGYFTISEKKLHFYTIFK